VQRLMIVTTALLAMLAGLYLSTRLNTPAPQTFTKPANANLLGQQQPGFKLLSNTGETITHSKFANETILINFWATWCVPCRAEMPMLMELHSEFANRGFQVVGIALDDVEQVNKFIIEFGISYPILVGEADVMDTSTAYGNVAGVLPYSVLVDKNGIIRWQYAGEIERDELTKLIVELL